MPDDPHRRDFLQSLAATSAVGLVPLTPAAASDDPPKQTDDDATSKKSPPSETDLRMELILARYGDRLDDDARRSVRRELDSIVKRAEALRKIPLENGDQPFPVFIPYRAPLADTANHQPGARSPMIRS